MATQKSNSFANVRFGLNICLKVECKFCLVLVYTCIYIIIWTLVLQCVWFGLYEQIKAKSVRSLPEDRRKVIPAEYGMPDPDNIPEGRASLRQALEFISQHHLDPKQNSALKIATDYKLDATKVQHVLKYFQMLRLHVPKEMLDKNPSLLSSLDSSSAKRQSISGMEDVMKLGQGVETVGNKASDPQPKN